MNKLNHTIIVGYGSDSNHTKKVGFTLYYNSYIVATWYNVRIRIGRMAFMDGLNSDVVGHTLIGLCPNRIGPIWAVVGPYTAYH